MLFLKTIAKKTGVDKAIAYSSGARIVQSVAGVLLVFIIASFLTAEEQGYYFTFNSVLSIQVFFELGFTTIITQFVAHEVSHLKELKDHTYEGEQYYKSRLSSLLHFSIKWYGIASLLFLFIVVFFGLMFFEGADEVVSWKMPWLLISIATAVKMFQSPITAILMGLDKVTEMNKIVFFQQLITPIVLCVGLVCKMKLYVLGLSSIATILVWFYYICKPATMSLLINVYKEPILDRVRYVSEIFPYQWRIALSSLSGYFIFYFLTPILFKYQGAIVAGQVGLTISIISTVQAMSMSWLNTKTPLYSRLIALKQYDELDHVFAKTMKQMLSICSCLMILAALVLTFIDYIDLTIGNTKIANRFLIGVPLIFLMIAYFSDQFTFSWASYLRCHKKEPFLWLSIVSGLLCLAAVFISAQFASISVVVFCYMLARLVAVPWGYVVYRRCKTKWHNL